MLRFCAGTTHKKKEEKHDDTERENLMDVWVGADVLMLTFPAIVAPTAAHPLYHDVHGAA